MNAPTRPPRTKSLSAHQRRVIEEAREDGLLDGETGRIAGRIKQKLIAAAKARSGIHSDPELLEYALAQVAMEDDFFEKIMARKGSVPRDIDLEF